MAEKEKETVVETAASDTIAPKGVATDTSKSSVLAIIMGQLSGMPLDDINGFAASLAQIGSESVVVPDNSVDHNRASIIAQPSFAVGSPATIVGQEAFKRSVNEDVEELLKGQELSEDFKEKTKVLFEAAVSARVVLEATKLQEEFEEQLVEAEEQLTEEMIEKVNSYLDYVVKEWTEENKVAIESSVETELTRSFMAGLKQLFEDHYIEIPEDKADVVSELADRVVELESALNDKIQENIDLIASQKELEKEKEIEKISEGMTLTDKDKLKTLCESLDFDNNDEFNKKAQIIKDQYFADKSKENAKTESVLLAEQMTSVDEIKVDSNGKPISEGPLKASNPEMQSFVDIISRTTRKTA